MKLIGYGAFLAVETVVSVWSHAADGLLSSTASSWTAYGMILLTAIPTAYHVANGIFDHITSEELLADETPVEIG